MVHRIARILFKQSAKSTLSTLLARNPRRLLPVALRRARDRDGNREKNNYWSGTFSAKKETRQAPVLRVEGSSRAGVQGNTPGLLTLVSPGSLLFHLSKLPSSPFLAHPRALIKLLKNEKGWKKTNIYTRRSRGKRRASLTFLEGTG